jgi:hypothetical protein
MADAEAITIGALRPAPAESAGSGGVVMGWASETQVSD